MNAFLSDTIAAVATAQGAGGIAVIRLSGERAFEIVKKAFRPAKPAHAFEPWRMMYGFVTDSLGEVLDEALCVCFPGPNSYTREDVAEIQCHGGSAAAARTLNRVLELGARPAGPGEFTRRAFLNGRIDLSRAEAVMELIGAGSEAAARAGVRQLEGGVSGFVRETAARIVEQLAAIEACTDFPDEVEEETAAPEIAEQLKKIREEIDRRRDPRGARILRKGASIVLAGRPNVGKSSLMNALLRQERAIVTSIPGTTRDVLTERISLGGVLAELSDTAGQREAEDAVERIGVDRARSAMEQADIVLIVLDASSPLTDSDRELLRGIDDRTVLLLNKCDLPCRVEENDLPAEPLRVSAGTGEGIEKLLSELETRVKRDLSEDSLTVERQLNEAGRASEALQSAIDAIESRLPLDVAAIDLKQALSALDAITLDNPTEDVIDEIFSRFCVGK